jgi:hypothetical protein
LYSVEARELTVKNVARILGITDEKDSCDCCGKSDLKSTVALELLDGSIVYYGTTCAGRAVGLKGKAASPQAVISKLEDQIKRREMLNRRKAEAQREADRGKHIVLVCRKGDHYLTVREAAFNARPALYGCPVFTCKPS